MDSKTREKQRENILSAAEYCFTRQGIALTTISDITKKAGIYRRTIYNYFTSKEEIASEIYHRYSEQELSFYLSPEDTGFQYLENVLTDWMSRMAEFRPYILFAIQFEYHFHNTGNERKILESGINFKIVNLLRNILSKGMKDGSLILPDGDFEMIVHSLLHTLMGYLLRVIHREEVFKMESGFTMEYFDLSLKIILRGLKA
jgi:AcrR family transcriptional regulator